MDESSKNYLLIALGPILVLALFLGGWFGWQWWQETQQPAPKAPFSFTINEEQQPSLEREIVIPEGFPADASRIVRQQIADLRERLEENPADYPSWLDLAINYKVIEDYEGAREIWEYVTLAAPMEPVSFQNLGNLYDLYLKDYEKAEARYKEAIRLAPDQAQTYMGLHELYRYSYKTDTNAAVEVLIEGVRAVTPPADFDLRVMLAGYYKEKGDTQNALRYYREAREQAVRLNNTALVQHMDTEIGALEQQ